MKLCVIILNYRRAGLTVGCLEALAPEIQSHDDRCAVCIDNGSDDGSSVEIEEAIRTRGWSKWVQFIKSPVNRGFAGGNNIGLRAVDAEYYMLLNSDSRPTPNSVSLMLETMDRQSDIGALGPRLQHPDGEPQISCFRYRTPISEMLEAASTGLLDRLFHNWRVWTQVYDEPVEPQWLSFACIMIRKKVVDQIGLMDENYFMYFEDIDYSRQIRKAGWRIVHDPRARVIHIRGGTSSVKAAMKAKKRVPRYYYESRSRYFAKFYGGVAGLWMTNVMWLAGRSIALMRETLGQKQRDVCELEARDNWTNWLAPMRPPAPQQGGEL